MPSESLIPDRRAQRRADQSRVGGADGDFGLIETLAYARDTGFALFAGHMERLARSAAELDFALDAESAKAALDEAVSQAPGANLRVRLVLWRGGALDATTTPLTPLAPGAQWRVAFAERRFHSAMPNLRHKTTRRALYEDELAHAVATFNVDEVIFLNERFELCEGARTTLFLRRDGALLTPPLHCGLLPGVLRASLLASGEAREAVLTRDDLASGQVLMGNSVRGLVPAQLIGGPRA